ncbi:MAG: TIGR02679 family protein [Rhodocyclaceae bacterium]|nr:MAG: TIGR02679 family protein [Rhodocyclaceae bacterium]
MTGTTDLRLVRLLGGEMLADLRRRLRQRYERATSSGTFRLNGLTDTERNALASLLGRKSRVADSMMLDVAELDLALQRAGLAESLRDALEQLEGLIVDRAAERVALQAQWSALLGRYDDLRLTTLLDLPRGMALVKRLARQPAAAERLLGAAQAVLRALPAAGIPRSRLAAEVLGDAHGLDQGRPVASIVLAALRRSTDTAEGEHRIKESVRDLWAEAGVMVNELSRPALFLNLPVHEGFFRTPVPGEPGYISLRTLLRTPPAWQVSGHDIYVCENPNLVAVIADALGADAAPIVCTDGMPSAAQRTLLLQLVTAGAHLHYHGDFDWPGLAIGNWVIRVCGASPWRFGSGDYTAALREIPSSGRALGPASVEADWDTGLASVMRDRDLAIDEEAVAAILIQDLESGGK